MSLLGHLFVQALALCQAAGVVRLDRVALDGTRVRANVLAAEVSALLADAERIDKDEDATFGKNRRGGAVSEQPRRRETSWPRSAPHARALASAERPPEDRRRSVYWSVRSCWR